MISRREAVQNAIWVDMGIPVVSLDATLHNSPLSQPVGLPLCDRNPFASQTSGRPTIDKRGLWASQAVMGSTESHRINRACLIG